MLIYKTMLPNIQGNLSRPGCVNGGKYFKTMSPIVPAVTVTISWLILPSMVRETASILFSSFTNNILPPNSPIRFGVSMVTLQPASTDLKAVKKEILSNGAINNCHLRVSIPQLTNIRKKTSQKPPVCQLTFICCQRRSRSGWFINCLYRLQLSKINKTGPTK